MLRSEYMSSTNLSELYFVKSVLILPFLTTGSTQAAVRQNCTNLYHHVSDSCASVSLINCPLPTPPLSLVSATGA